MAADLDPTFSAAPARIAADIVEGICADVARLRPEEDSITIDGRIAM
jgi:hypothetical protein